MTPQQPPRADWQSRGYLPHLYKPGGTYFVTFRLGDSLPQEVLAAYQAERLALLNLMAANKRTLTDCERTRLATLFCERVDTALDARAGSCILRHEPAAQVVADAIQFFAGERHALLAWCVMPNHVHTLLRPETGHGLPDILQSWKSFTAKKINKLFGQTGRLWMPEWYDHLVRDREELLRFANYTMDNPKRAGLTNWPWVGVDL